MKIRTAWSLTLILNFLGLGLLNETNVEIEKLILQKIKSDKDTSKMLLWG